MATGRSRQTAFCRRATIIAQERIRQSHGMEQLLPLHPKFDFGLYVGRPDGYSL